PIPRQDRRRGSWVIPLSAATVAFPFILEGRLLRRTLSGPARRSPKLRPARSLNRFTRSVVIQGFDPLVTSEPLALLPARTTKLPGGIRTHRKTTPLPGAQISRHDDKPPGRLSSCPPGLPRCACVCKTRRRNAMHFPALRPRQNRCKG